MPEPTAATGGRMSLSVDQQVTAFLDGVTQVESEDELRAKGKKKGKEGKADEAKEPPEGGEAK